MNKLFAIDRRAGVVLALAVSATIGSAVAQAGPGCMNNQRYMGHGNHAYSPMGQHPAYVRPAPFGYYAAPATRTMAPYYRPPMNVQRADPGVAGQAAARQSVAAADTVTVRINGMRFEPALVTVKPGTTVTWIHESRMPHTITGKTDELRSSTLNTGQQFSHTFDAVGSYSYVCEFHPDMRGSVIVESDGLGT